MKQARDVPRDQFLGDSVGQGAAQDRPGISDGPLRSHPATARCRNLRTAAALLLRTPRILTVCAALAGIPQLVKRRRCAALGPALTPGPATAKPLISQLSRQGVAARTGRLPYSPGVRRVRGSRSRTRRPQPQSPRGPLLTFGRGDEAVGVDEADSRRTDPAPEECAIAALAIVPASYYGRTLKAGLYLCADVGGNRMSGDQQAEQRSSPAWLFGESQGRREWWRRGLLGGFASGVSASWFVGRQGRHRQRVRRQMPQRGSGTAQRVTSQEREAGKGGSRGCRLWRGGHGPVRRLLRLPTGAGR
jgi:hypothetical protein